MKIFPVDAKLYRGGKLPLSDVPRLKKQGITQVCDLRTNGAVKRNFLKIFYKIFNIDYKNTPFHIDRIELPDTDVFEKITGGINQNPGKTYIHCRNGNNRTGLVIAFYELKNGKKPQEILNDLISMGYGRHRKVKSQEITDLRAKHLKDFAAKYLKLDT